MIAARRPEDIIELLKQPAGLKGDAEFSDALKAMRAEDFRESVAFWQRAAAANFSDMELEHRVVAIMDRWFELDAESAKRVVEELCREGTITEIVAGRAARNDPRWAIENLVLDAKSNWAGAVVEEVAKSDPSLAKAWIDKLQNLKEHRPLLEAFVRGFAERNPIAAMDFAVSADRSEPTFATIVIEAAAARGRLIARDVLAKISDPGRRQRLAILALEPLARETLTNPFEFLEEVIGTEHLPKIRNDLPVDFSNLVQADPGGAADWAVRLPAESRSDFLSGILYAWTNFDPAAAQDWMEEKSLRESNTLNEEQSQPVTDLNRMLTARRLLTEGQKTDALEAISKVTPSDLSFAIIYDVVEQDPAVAAKWVAGLQSSKMAAEAALPLSIKLTTTDPGAAAAWVQQLPAGATRDSALTGMILRLTEIDPEGASQWVPLCSTPSMRQRRIKTIYQSWLGHDSMAAREWVRNFPGVDERWKVKLLRQYP
jgi:hypothetical protein